MQGHSHGNFDSEHIASALETEGELVAELTAEAIELCADRLAVAGVGVKRIVDLGCGPAGATVQLAQRFPRAAIVAVDGSAPMLAAARRRIEHHRLADRVTTRLLDLDADLEPLGTCELAYAAMAIHHARDEVATLANIRKLLAPRGLVCLLERDEPAAVRLSTDLERPGLWDRLRAARLQRLDRMRPTLPGATGAERYPEFLTTAGFEVIVARTLRDTVIVRDDTAMHRWVAAQLKGAVQQLDGIADPADLDAVSTFLNAADAHADPRWRGAAVTISRTLLIACGDRRGTA